MQKIFLTLLISMLLCAAHAQQIYVAPGGNDQQAGSIKKPLKTLAAAVAKASSMNGTAVTIFMRAGTYPLNKTLVIPSASLSSLLIRPYANEKVIITGSTLIKPNWQPHNATIWKAKLDLPAAPDQFFVNGKSQPMARYPNYNKDARVFNGTAADAISPDRIATWKDPSGGYIHALHQGEWGAFHYRITGKLNGALQYEGGWQNNRPAPMHKQHRFVENIFEELDAPGEWFYNSSTKTIFYYPTSKEELSKARFTISQLTDLIHIQGSNQQPAKNITIQNLSFTQTARTFMDVKEPLLRSDWTIYRGGAILLEQTEQIRIHDCDFYELGGNAVFLSGYNKDALVSDNHIRDIGANAIAFVGKPSAVRSPAFRYENFVPWNEMDYTPGPNGNDYPQSCTASGNLIHHIGRTEKQIAGIEISMASTITIAHNSIYHVPRSGINISEGTWGGHILEFNDVFNTVLETGDHGAFNSWGRDRYWRPQRELIDSIVAAKPGIELLDAINPVIIRNNRFQCDHGWDIDLDDGSSNYQIYNNICLNGGLKLREGYHRTVTNNILVNNSFHPHVWLKNSGDVFMHNIVTTAYAPILMNHWGRAVDSNYFLSADGLAAAQALGLDQHGLSGDAGFVDANAGNYSLKPGSPALQAGFKNFDMNVGVQKASLKSLAEKPTIMPLLTAASQTPEATIEWLGARFKNIETLGERSAAGLHNNDGALIMEAPPESLPAKSGLRKGDVIIKMGDREIRNTTDLLKNYQALKWMGHAECIIVRNQAEQKINLNFK